MALLLPRVGLVVAAGSVASLIVLHPDLGPLATVLLVAVAFTGWALVVIGADGALGGRTVGAVIGGLLVLAVVVAPRGSHDLWGYVIYGRILSVHHASPYVATPATYAHDHLLHLMGSGYRHTRSPYGPAFTVLSAVGTAAAGPSALANRLVFQGLAALAIGLALLVLWRRTHSPAALAWVGLNPLVLTSVVNDGHNDALVALAILAGVFFATDNRRVAAGVALGLGTLVKLPAVLALGGVGLWTVRARGARAACTTAGVGLGVVALGYLPVARSAISALGESGQVVTRMSLWAPVRQVLLDAGHADATSSLTTLGLVAVVALSTLLAWAWSRDPDPATSAAGATAGFTLAGSYVLPWYATWGLPALATRRPNPLAWLVAIQGAFLLAVYQLPGHASSAANGAWAHVLFTDVVPLALGVTAVGLAVRHIRLGPRRAQGGDSTPKSARALPPSTLDFSSPESPLSST